MIGLLQEDFSLTGGVEAVTKRLVESFLRAGKEIKVYSEEDHLGKLSEQQRALYEKLKATILALDDIEVEVKKLYIAFKGRTNIVDVVVKQKSLEVNINMKKGTLKDPLKITRDISKVGHWANGDYRVDIKTEDDIDNLVPLIKQSIKVNGR